MVINRMEDAQDTKSRFQLELYLRSKQGLFIANLNHQAYAFLAYLHKY